SHTRSDEEPHPDHFLHRCRAGRLFYRSAKALALGRLRSHLRFSASSSAALIVAHRGAGSFFVVSPHGPAGRGYLWHSPLGRRFVSEVHRRYAVEPRRDRASPPRLPLG